MRTERDGVIGHNGHEYPSRYAPGPDQPAELNDAWALLDMIKPGIIPADVRALLAGGIVGLLIKAKIHNASH